MTEPDGADHVVPTSEPEGDDEAESSDARPLVALLTGVVVAAGVRVWQIGGRPPLEWNDTADILTSSRASWLSPQLWVGRRPLGAPLLLKLVGGDTGAYIVWQAALAVACWVALAASVATVVASRRARWVGAAAVLAFSITAPVTMWERSVLSESLAISLLALTVAAGVQVARGVTGPRVAALLAALALWLATRDGHAVVAVVGGAAVVVGVTVSWLRTRPRHGAAPGQGPEAKDASHLAHVLRSGSASGGRRPLLALGVGALALGLLVGLGSSHGERHAFPMRNVFEVRVLPYPDRVHWFADHGMPQAEMFLGPDARTPHTERGGPPVVYVADDDAELAPWRAWVGTDGLRAFAEFAATHPLYLVSEPFRSPERAFNNAHGDRGFYSPQDMPRVPLVDPVLALPTTVVLMVAATAGGWALGRRRSSPALAVGVVTAALAVPHGLFAWHSDGMETARHLVVPALQLHLGVLLMVIGTLEGITSVARRSPVTPGGDEVVEATDGRADGVDDGDAGLTSAHG